MNMENGAVGEGNIEGEGWTWPAIFAIAGNPSKRTSWTFDRYRLVCFDERTSKSRAGAKSSGLRAADHRRSSTAARHRHHLLCERIRHRSPFRGGEVGSALGLGDTDSTLCPVRISRWQWWHVWTLCPARMRYTPSLSSMYRDRTSIFCFGIMVGSASGFSPLGASKPWLVQDLRLFGYLLSPNVVLHCKTFHWSIGVYVRCFLCLMKD